MTNVQDLKDAQHRQWFHAAYLTEQEMQLCVRYAGFPTSAGVRRPEDIGSRLLLVSP